MTTHTAFTAINAVRNSSDKPLNWPEIVDGLSSAIAFLLIAEMPDPSNTGAVDELIKHIGEDIRANHKIMLDQCNADVAKVLSVPK